MKNICFCLTIVVTLPTGSDITTVGEMRQQNKISLHNNYIFNTNKVKSNICTVRIVYLKYDMIAPGLL